MYQGASASIVTRVSIGACAAAVAAFNAPASTIEYTDQFNWLTAGIGEAHSSIQNSDIGPFRESISVQSPHPDADLSVTAQQSLSLGTDMSDGESVITFDGGIGIAGSDFFDDDSGGLFDVSAITQTKLTFELHQRTGFNAFASATSSLIGASADVVVIDLDDDPFKPLFQVAAGSEEEAKEVLHLGPGTYLIDAFSSFHFLGPGEWDGEAGYAFSLSVVPAPVTMMLFAFAAGVAGLRTRRRHRGWNE